MITIFIVATKDQAKDEVLKSRITTNFPVEHYEMGRGQWLVAFTGTARELYLKLVPEYSPQTSSQSPLTGTVVFGIGGYFGVTSRDMWDWMATKLGGESA